MGIISKISRLALCIMRCGWSATKALTASMSLACRIVILGKEKQIKNLKLSCVCDNVFCPHPAGAFAADHACAYGFGGGAGFHKHGALFWLNFSYDNEVTFAAEKYVLALFYVDAIFFSGVKLFKLGAELICAFGKSADAAPVSRDDVKGFLHHCKSF